ncbi:MAG: aminopeptidase P family protein [Vicinamibacteria bacterium]|nr:aminopeptidase P family protein [Vicinamibacteria bacterium]
MSVLSHNRRDFFKTSGAAAFGATVAGAAVSSATEQSRDESLPAPITALKPMTSDVTPISMDERKARIAKAQKLLADTGMQALVMASGTSLDYFTGARWGLSERFFGCVITRDGDPAWVTPAFEKARALEQVKIGRDVRAWEEHESPSALLATILKDRGVTTGKIGIEETMPFTFADAIAKAAPATQIVNGTPVSAGCRMIKDAHEISLMRRACEITVTAHRAVFASLKEGMTQEQVGALSAAAHRRLGMGGGSLVLFGKDAAFPHGTTTPQPLKAGDAVLLDGGGKLHGYSSDITRTGIFGAKPTDRQRLIWNTVRKAQEAAFNMAKPGVECQAVDAAARKIVTDAGFGKDYEMFGHRVGHGIGMDGHEWTYFVRGNTTKLQPGMCFSDEPGIYIYGEIGIRHEDVIFITESGAENMTKWTGSPEDPAVV